MRGGKIIAGSSSSHLNHRESSQSNKAGLKSNMVPCFPASNDTDGYHCDTVSNRSSPSHFTNDSPSIISLIFPKSEPDQLQTLYTTAYKDITWEIVIRRNAHAAVHLRELLNQFQDCVISFTW